ncbi:MAG: type IV toxin-antitoxin system AbiEi family antitoxin domain-containing protein [Bdellovibrionota bacterium]
MSLLNNITPLLESPSFSSKEAKAHGVSHNVLAWYVKQGVLTKLGRGLYCKSDSDLPEVEMKHEELIRIMAALPQGVVCLTAALDLYGLTEEFIRSYTIAIQNTCRARKIQHATFFRFRDMDTGRTSIKLGSYEIPIFDRERTIIDSFRLLSIETSIKALKMAWRSEERIDLRKLHSYADKLRFDILPYLLTVTT